MSPRLRWAHLVGWAAVAALRYHYLAPLGSRPPTLPPPRSPSPPARPRPRTLTAVVARATRYPPFRTTCIVRSLVLARMLRRYGYPAQVVVGVQPGTRIDPTDRFAHAWVELDGVALGPDGRASASHSELTRLS